MRSERLITQMPCVSAPRRRLPGAWRPCTHGHLHVIPGPASSLSCKMCNFRPSRGTQAPDGDHVPAAGGFRQTHPLGRRQPLARGRQGPVHLSLRPACGECGAPPRPFSERPPRLSAVQSRGSWGREQSPRGARQASCASWAALLCCAWGPGGIGPARSPAPPPSEWPARTGLQTRPHRPAEPTPAAANKTA